MAHADYECCAVCDKRLSYSSDAMAKAVLCSRCAVELAVRGVIVHDVDELKSWLLKEDPEKIRRVLTDLGYTQCYYSSEVDDIVIRRLKDSTFGARNFSQ